MDALQIVHTQVLMHVEDAFTDREEDLKRLRDLLWRGGTAALTRAGHGRRRRDDRGDYHGVWWLRAERTETLIDDLIPLGEKDIRGRGQWDGTQLARLVLLAQKEGARVF